MSIYQTPSDDLALLISAAVGTSVPSTHYTITGLIPTPAGESTYNTKIRVKFVSPSIYSGEKTLYYDRLNLADIGNLHPFTDGRIKSQAGPGTSLYILFQNLRDSLGIQFDTNELEETFGVDDGAGISFVLKAKPKALGWVGTHTQKFSYYPNIVNAFWGSGLAGF